MEQNKINRNLHERLQDIEAREHIFIALLVSLIETHPRPDVFRKQFNFHVETMRAGWLARPLEEAFLDEAERLHKLFGGAFDRTKL